MADSDPETAPADPPIDRIARISEVSRLCGLSRSSILKAARAGRFPATVRLLERSFGWRISEISAWIESRERVNFKDMDAG